MKTDSVRLAEAITKYLNSMETNERLVIHQLDGASDFVLNRMFNLMLAFIYSQASRYEDGLIPEGQYDNVVICKHIKDDVIEPFVDYEGGIVTEPRRFISP